METKEMEGVTKFKVLTAKPRKDLTQFMPGRIDELHILFEDCKKKNKPLMYHSAEEKTQYVQRLCVWLEKEGYLHRIQRIEGGWMAAALNEKGKALNIKEEYERQFFEAVPSMKRLMDTFRPVKIETVRPNIFEGLNKPIHIEPLIVEKPKFRKWFDRNEHYLKIVGWTIALLSLAIAVWKLKS